MDPEAERYLIKEMLPVDVFVYIGDFVNSKDYVSFIRGLWPNRDEDQLVREKLQKKSTHRMVTEFINGETLQVEYNYDHTRIDEEVLVNVNTLLPVFGGQVPPDVEAFVDVKRLTAFVEMSVFLNECRRYTHAACPCHLDVEPEAAADYEPPSGYQCADRHFHHFCWRHVNYWLTFVLERSIKTMEEGSFDEEATSEFVAFLDNTIYFQNGKPLSRSSSLFRHF